MDSLTVCFTTKVKTTPSDSSARQYSWRCQWSARCCNSCVFVVVTVSAGPPATSQLDMLSFLRHLVQTAMALSEHSLCQANTKASVCVCLCVCLLYKKAFVNLCVCPGGG